MAFAVIEKDLATDTILTVVQFTDESAAAEWADEMMTLYEEERAYKILPIEPKE